MQTLGEELTRRGHTIHFLTEADGPERTAVINGVTVTLVPKRLLSKSNRTILDKFVGMIVIPIVAWLANFGKQGHFLTGILNRIPQMAIRKSHASWPFKNKVVQIVEDYGIELIHAYETFPDSLVASLVGDELHLPVVLRMGGRAWIQRYKLMGKIRRNNYRNQLRYVFESADCLAFNSLALKKHHTEKFQEWKIRPLADQTVFDIGIRVPTELNKASDPFAELETSDRLILSCVARFKKNLKRQELLVRAIKLLDDEFPLTLIFAGDGPDRNEVERLVRAEGVGEHVVFLGSITHGSVFRLLRGSDIVLHPSEFEGSSKAIAEAMFCGKPVIASDIPSTREHIQDGVTGILSDNSAQSFADKIRELVSRPALRERIGNNARAYATHEFDSRRNVVMYEKLFRTLVNRSQGDRQYHPTTTNDWEDAGNPEGPPQKMPVGRIRQ